MRPFLCARGCSTRDSPCLVQLFCCRLPLLSLDERDVRDGMTVLDLREHAHREEALVFCDRPAQDLPQRELRLGHCLALTLRGCEVLTLADRLRLRNLTGLMIDRHFVELVALHRVHGEL